MYKRDSKAIWSERRVNELDIAILKLFSVKKKEKWLKKCEQNLKDLWNAINQTNICIVGLPQGQEEEKGREIIWRDSGQNLSNFDERCEYKYLSSPVNTK